MAERRFEDEIEEILFYIQNGESFLLSGGAGSGKTYTLIEVLKKISQNYPIANIACITYTNAAAIEIGNRTKINNMTVSTIHDFLWDSISPFQKEMQQTLVEVVNDPESKITNPNGDEPFSCEFKDGIQYKEYVRLNRGEISHDEVIILAHAMYKKYIKLCDILIDKYPFIFVDEYQDTSPYVIEILLTLLSASLRKNIIGLFGDSMQSIYETGVGNIEYYIENGYVQKVEKKQNRRNPESVIAIANQLRTDGLQQEPSDDITAPNMTNGKVRKGSAVFLYSDSFDLKKVKSSDWCSQWNFSDSKNTKELRLTYNLIASEAGFEKLMEIYDIDPIYKFKNDLKKIIKERKIDISPEQPFDEVVTSIDWCYSRGENAGRQHKNVLLDDPASVPMYEFIKDWPYKKVQSIYLDKDNLIDNKIVVDEVTAREPKRDRLIQHLFKIQELITLYQDKKYNEVIRKTSFCINNQNDKKRLKELVEKLESMGDASIESAIEFAHLQKICIKDDKLVEFVKSNEYLYWRVKDIHFRDFQNLYKYLEGYTPLSTQHKIKGLEFENVLIILSNGGWSNYNFEYLFNKSIESKLSPARKNSYPSILSRTQKLFYVCCTRAKENLIVFYPEATEEVLCGAKAIFGESNCYPI